MLKKTSTGTVIVNPGIKMSKAWDGAHQGCANVRAGVYWEAVFDLSREERLVQKALLAKGYVNTRERSVVMMRLDQNGRQKRLAELEA